MTRTAIKPAVSAVKELLAQEPDALREIVRSVMQAMLEAGMEEALGAGKSERSDARTGYRSGHYPRTPVDRQSVGLGKGVSVRVHFDGRRIHKQKKEQI